MANFFLLGVPAGPVCTAALVRLGYWREKDASILRGGSFDLGKRAHKSHWTWVRKEASTLLERSESRDGTQFTLAPAT